jgi:hypothetical protein
LELQQRLRVIKSEHLMDLTTNSSYQSFSSD